MFQDLRLGLRMSLKNRGFTVVAALTPALGIGANTSVFSVAYTTLLRPLPFRDQERLIVAWKSDATTKHSFVEISIPEFDEGIALRRERDRSVDLRWRDGDARRGGDCGLLAAGAMGDQSRSDGRPAGGVNDDQSPRKKEATH
ncbi:MAG: hypothetical protein J2P52_10400 [Blastocatellia bacterium]|nr:hypothetical protein [Blastocatellia bacterium]